MMSQTTEQIRWTIHDLEVLPQREGNRYELIDGELLVTRSPHRKHQQVAGRIFTALDTWSELSGLGEAILSPGIILSDTDNIIPDLVWVSKERLTLIENEAGHLIGLPELVVEVLSPGEHNIRRDRETKLKLYSVQGVQEYWIADRWAQRLEIYLRENRQLSLVKTLLNSDHIESPLLPGFDHPIRRCFG